MCIYIIYLCVYLYHVDVIWKDINIHAARIKSICEQSNY